MKYCIAPFSSPSITPDGFMICSQPGQKVYKDIEFWNSDEVKEIRKQIINEEIPESCKACRAIRDGLITSDKKPESVDVPLNFDNLWIARSNKCDYACEMCSASISHTYDKVHNDGKLGIIENNFDLTPYLGDTKYAAISGGNPVLDKKLLDVLHHMNPDKVKRIIFTSNGSAFPEKFLDALKRFKCDVGLIFSIDGPKGFNEIARAGAKQERIYKTIDKVLKSTENHPNISVSVECTITSKSIDHYVDLYDEMVFGLEGRYLSQKAVHMIINICGYPAHLSATQIPKSTYDAMKNQWMPYFKKQRIHLADQFYMGAQKILQNYDNSVIM